MHPLRSLLLPLSLLSLTGAQSPAPAPALNEPADGSVYLGAWVDTSTDSPLALNTRVGRNMSWFQFAQNIPVDNLDQTTGTGGIINASMLWDTDTDAGIYITVYPIQGLAAVKDQDWAALGVQLQSYALAGRAVFLRFAPEMNGNWDIWGIQPTLFKSVWITMHSYIKSACPSCALVWSPNASPGYPYSITPDMIANATDRAALDTSGDGIYDEHDDAYAPYYPGDEYVDWAGVSYYYKGVYPNSYNVAQQPGTVEAAMTGYAQAGLEEAAPVQYTPFYQNYCQNKPCMFSESGAAWHVNETQIPAGYVEPSHTTVEQAWWRDGLTNETFLATFPRLKMLMMFEWEKVETDGGISTLRDFRITNDSTVLAAFQQDLLDVQDRYVWANPLGAAQASIPAQVPLPQPSPARATPYRSAPPTTPSLFSGSPRSIALVGSAILTGVVLGVSTLLL